MLNRLFQEVIFPSDSGQNIVVRGEMKDKNSPLSICAAHEA